MLRVGSRVRCMMVVYDLRRARGRPGRAQKGSEGVVKMLEIDPETAERSAIVRFVGCTARVNVRALEEL